MKQKHVAAYRQKVFLGHKEKPAVLHGGCHWVSVLKLTTNSDNYTSLPRKHVYPILESFLIPVARV
ncbi:uncharacterized protein METZ01_LOCUS51461 [marine metagenome]|uniref:Uncharacterized protein n=1 Tax=marine metagenome TaxID=408172 RepID=A0A381S8N5_9ZZZZ